ncbi:hypothetical protein CRUP_012749, partial [Coryphaenoides rupestris]
VVTEQTRPGVGPGVVGLVLQLCDPGFCSPAEQKELLVVQTVVELLHRHWLELRDRQTALPVPVGGVLREALLLLHWLLAHHGGFSEGCRAVLHLYHQVVPALRDAVRTSSTPLTYSEELALEEVCRSEADDADDMDTETGS